MACSRSRMVLAIVAVTVLALAASVNAAVLFTESFEDPDVLDGGDTDPTGWSTTGHPSYLRLVDENDTPSLFTTPDGSQGLSCYNGNRTSFATTTSSILSDSVSVGTTYTLSFNVSKTGANYGEYYGAILAVDGGGTETVLASLAGDNDGSNDMSYSDSVSVTATGNAGERLAVRVGMDPDYSDWHRSCIIDNVQLDAASAGPPPPAPSHMISHYPFDGDTSDGGTLGNTAGALVGDAGFSPGKLGQALQLDGDGDYFDTNRDSPYDFTGGPLTFSFWAKLDEDGWNEQWECMIGKGEGGAWRLARNGGNQDRVKYSTFAVAPADLRDREWHHFTATNSAGATEIFFDGNSAGTGGGTIGNAATDLWIGNNPQKSGRAFGGWIDDVGIWDVVLSDEWAKAMFDLAIDPAFGYNAGQVNELGLLHAQGAGTALIGFDLWEYAQEDPGDDLTFVPFAADGSGVHFVGVVPEPATLSLVGLGALLALRRRRSR